MSRNDEIRKRLGVLVGGKELDRQIPEWVKEQLGEKIGEDDVRESLRVIHVMITVLTGQLKAFVSLVKKEASAEGIILDAFSANCHLKRCGTCRGKYSTHYPKWRTYTGEFGKWRAIKTHELTDFLRKFVGEDEIEAYYALYGLRVIVLGIYNYYEAWSEKFGLIKGVEEDERIITV